MRYILILFGLILSTGIGCAQIEKNEKLVHALSDTSITIRGNLIKISENNYRLDYYDVSENDSHSQFLQSKGYQGGGYSWDGIVFGAINLSDPNIMYSLKLDPEADGLAMWSKDKNKLEKIGRLIATVKSDNEILLECIAVAESRFVME